MYECVFVRVCSLHSISTTVSTRYPFSLPRSAPLLSPVCSRAYSPRQLHNTHWGYICPAETPEGGAVGLVKNMALMAYISVGSPSGTSLRGVWERERGVYAAVSLSLSLSLSLAFFLSYLLSFSFCPFYYVSLAPIRVPM